MHKEQINDKEALCILILYILGTTLIVGIGGEAKKDAWIALIIAIIGSLPLVLVYARILALFPGKNIFEILELVLGRYLGMLVTALYTWYAFHLGALVLRNFGEFLRTVTMPETPMLVPMLFLVLTAIIAARSGVEVLGRTCAYAFPLFYLIIFTVQILAIPQLDFDNLKPILANGLTPVLKAAFSAFTFPFAETVLFTGVFFSVQTKGSLYKIYTLGLVLAGMTLLWLNTRNILVLGEMLGSLYFPSHVAVSRINIGQFLQRIEVSVATVFVFGAFVKSSVCLLVTCKGLAHILKLNTYKTIVTQVGLLMTYLAFFIYADIMTMRYWAFKVYPYYAFPFEVIIPCLLLIIAEIKQRFTKKSPSTA